MLSLLTRYANLALVTVLSVVLFACAPAAPDKKPMRYLWPLPPETPRVEWLTCHWTRLRE